ncbi:unnamed protein product [Rhizoctonia solani]|uniref:Uncharacterized protein n=1 Tax=Rhizoctonia solani TaxID=456999 RepID=A0A8H3DY42_9AGAM|nr:unnamed protein product [Rhizoctonia solani]
MDAWCGHTMAGQPKERCRFARQHTPNIDRVLEILLRLVRSKRATARSGGGNEGGGQQQTHSRLFTHCRDLEELEAVVVAAFRKCVMLKHPKDRKRTVVWIRPILFTSVDFLRITRWLGSKSHPTWYRLVNCPDICYSPPKDT